MNIDLHLLLSLAHLAYLLAGWFPWHRWVCLERDARVVWFRLNA